MIDDKYLLVAGVGLSAILYLETVDSNLNKIKADNDMLIQKEVERTKYLEQTQNNILKAYTLGRQSSCEE